MNKQELYPCKDSWKSENTWQTVALSEAMSLHLPVVVHKEKLKSPHVSGTQMLETVKANIFCVIPRAAQHKTQSCIPVD